MKIEHKVKKYAVTFTVRPKLYPELKSKAAIHHVVVCEDEFDQKCVFAYAVAKKLGNVRKNFCGRYSKGAMRMTADRFFSIGL